MKQALLILTGVFVTLFLFSCKKDKDITKEEKPSVVGYWEGSMTITNGSNKPFAVVFKSDGTGVWYLNLTSATVDTTITTSLQKGTITYSIADQNLSAKLQYLQLKYTIAGVFDTNFKTLNATMGVNNESAGYSTFLVFKK